VEGKTTNSPNYEQEPKLVGVTPIDLGGSRVATPGVVEQVCQVEEEKRGSKCVAKVASGDLI
jgi:hypothetical protein